MNEAIYRLATEAARMAGMAEAGAAEITAENINTLNDAIEIAFKQHKTWEDAYYKLLEENVRLKCQLGDGSKAPF